MKSHDVFRQKKVSVRSYTFPNHGFDELCLSCVRDLEGINYVLDGVSFRPFRQDGLGFVPQYSWDLPRFGVGLNTVCLHPDMMSDTEIDAFISRLSKVKRKFVSLDDVIASGFHEKGLLDWIFEIFIRISFSGVKVLKTLMTKIW